MVKTVWDVLTDYVEGAFCAVASELITADFSPIKDVNSSKGYRFATIINFVGQFRGRILVSCDAATAAKITTNMNFGEAVESLEEQCLYLAEFTNMLGGKITTLLNNSFRGSELRLTPPAMFAGNNLEVQTPAMRSTAYYFEGSLGSVTLEIGVEGA